MPLSSFEISQMNAAFQGAAMGQMNHAAMIGSNASLAHSAVGRGINTGSAIGGPMAMAGLSLAGLDPISLGLRAGMGASGMGMGLAGAGAVGLGAAGLAGAGLMGVQYAAGQMVQGAQQQQQLGQQLNSTFRFPNQIGTTGFTRGGVGDIGSMMRQMTTQQGGMGEMVGFEELGRLASNMGRMGMTQGVRDAKEFSTKFREMIKSVKEIATSMGTSLEEAQQVMVAMRGSGIFGAQSASTMSQRVRSSAFAGGMATSEVTGMMQVGSQISRMVGGRGAAGARGGLETITNIGVAQQMGIMSEEDIYNATGLTGAEGRRALATNQMQTSAQFLRGDLGRRFLASVAGKNGKLDSGSVEEMMSGVGTGRTMSMAHSNLNKVGRANFIRNEGKLRGAALEQFGGLAPMIAMKGWLEERGMDVNEDSDRAMIFMQRKLGMGNDEAEMMLRQVRELPNIMRQRKASGEDDQFFQSRQRRLSQTGVEGIKRKFEKARADINASLQQVGADFSEGMEAAVEDTLNRITGTKAEEIRRDVTGGFRAAMGGGSMGAGAASSIFGLGGGSLATRGALGGGGSFLSGYKSKATGQNDLSTFNTANGGMFGAGTDADRFSKAGFGFTGGSLSEHLQTVSGISSAFKTGGEGVTGMEGLQKFGAANRGAFTKAFATGDIGGGFGGLAAFGKMLGGLSGGGDIAKRFAGAGRVEQARMMAAMTGNSGARVTGVAEQFQAPELLGQYGASGFSSESASALSLGRAFHGGQVNHGDEELTGKELMSDEFTGILKSVFSGNQETRDAGMADLHNKLKEEKDKLKNLGFFASKSGSQQRIQALQGAVYASELGALKASGASEEEIQAKAKQLARQYGDESPEAVMRKAAAVQARGAVNEMTARNQALERFGGRAREGIDALRKGGLVTGTGDDVHLDASTMTGIQGAGEGSAGRRVLQAMFAEQKNLASGGVGATEDAKNLAASRIGSLSAERRDALAGMSVSQMRELAQGLQGTAGTGDIRGELMRVAGSGERLQKGGARSAISDLGISMSKDEVSAMLKKGGTGALAQEVAGRLGGGDNKDLIKDLESMLKSVTGKKGVEGALKLDALLDSDEVKKMRQKLKEDSDKADPNKNLEKMGSMAEYMTGAFKSQMTQQTIALNAMAKIEPDGPK